MPAPWKKEETEFLRENHSTMTSAEIAQHLGKTHRAVTQKATYEGVRCLLRSTDGKKGWTKSEILELGVLAETYSMATAAAKMGRTKSSIAQVAMHHKISFHKRRMTNQQVADIIGVHRETVRRIRDKLGLQFRRNIFTTDAQSRTRGATGSDIVAIVRHILNNPAGLPQNNLKVTAKHLRQVIKDWEGYE